MIKAVIFDFDGVIADSLGLNHLIFLRESSRMKLVVPQDVDFYRNMFETNPFEELEKVGYYIDEANADNYRKLYLENIHTAVIFPGMKDALEKLKGKYRLCIVTSNYTECVESFMKINKIRDFFDMIITADVSRRKEIKINMFLEKFSLDKDDVVFVGDTNSDIDASKKSGIRAVAVTWGYHNKKNFKNKPDFIADKPEDIVKILEKL